jgi:toxin ParE1/3/4
MNYPVRLTSAALRDLEEIFLWIEEHDSLEKAGNVLDRLYETTAKFSAMPRRGSRPSELPPGTEAEYYQIFFKPYRIIYEVALREVVVHAILDGRRNLQSLLLKRLLGEH